MVHRKNRDTDSHDSRKDPRSVNFSAVQTVCEHARWGRTKKEMLHHHRIAMPGKSNDADKTIRLLSRKREREGTIWQERLVFNPADDQFLFLPVVFSQFDCLWKLVANRKGNKGKVVLFESRERKCLIFFLSQKFYFVFWTKIFLRYIFSLFLSFRDTGPRWFQSAIV